MLKILFIIAGMFLCSGIAIRVFKDLTSNRPIAQFVWHCMEMGALILFLSAVIV